MVSVESTRYLSLRFYSSRLRERGVVWCLRRAAGKLTQLILLTLLSPVWYVLHLAGVRFLAVATQHLGHLACEPDCYVKEGLLGMRPRHCALVLVNSGEVANRHLLDYWRPHLRFVDSPLVAHLLTPLAWSTRLQHDVRPYITAINETARYATIQRAWADRGPLLSLSPEDRERGEAALRAMGLPAGAWFVCVHCREAVADDDAHDYRNAEIENYSPAMKAIVKRGGWCIRMGEANTKPLPPMEHVVDYANLSIRSEWLDVFLAASCRFFLGGSSGLYNAASVFGVPSAVANQAPVGVVLPYGRRDVGIPKLAWSEVEERYLTFREVMKSPVAGFRASQPYKDAGVRLHENSAEDIRDLAVEMLERCEGSALYTVEDGRLQASFKSLLKPGHYSYGAVSRVGRDFLRKYGWLLDDGAGGYAIQSQAVPCVPKYPPIGV